VTVSLLGDSDVALRVVELGSGGGLVGGVDNGDVGLGGGVGDDSSLMVTELLMTRFCSRKSGRSEAWW
jgi:hypothetical protein